MNLMSHKASSATMNRDQMAKPKFTEAPGLLSVGQNKV